MISITILRTRMRVALVAAALALGMAAPAVLAATSNDTVAAPPPEAAAIKKTLQAKFPGAQVGIVTRSPYFGLFEVQFDNQLVYTDAKAKYIISGAVYDTDTKTNLTEARMRKLNRVDVASLPLDLAFKRVKGSGERKLIVFSDADCPFCAKLESELKDVDNVTIYTFLFPIDTLHPDSARKSRMIWCSADKVKAWDEFFGTGTLPDNTGDCDNPVLTTRELGEKLRINATPTLIFADGSMVPGAIPPARMEEEFKNAAANAAPTAKKPVTASK